MNKTKSIQFPRIEILRENSKEGVPLQMVAENSLLQISKNDLYQGLDDDNKWHQMHGLGSRKNKKQKWPITLLQKSNQEITNYATKSRNFHYNDSKSLNLNSFILIDQRNNNREDMSATKYDRNVIKNQVNRHAKYLYRSIQKRKLSPADALNTSIHIFPCLK